MAFWENFLKGLGSGIAQGGTTIGQGVQQQQSIRMQQQREEDEEAYKQLQQIYQTLQKDAKVLEGTPMGEIMNQAANAISQQGIEGAREFLSDFSLETQARQAQAQTPEAQGGPARPGGIFAGPGGTQPAPEPQAGAQGPTGPLNLSQIQSMGGAQAEEITRGQSIADMSWQSALEFASDPALGDEARELFVNDYLGAVGDQLHPSIKSLLQARAGAKAAPVTFEGLNQASADPARFAREYGSFVSETGEVKEDAPDTFKRWAQGRNVGEIVREGRQEQAFENAMQDTQLEGAQVEVARATQDMDFTDLKMDEFKKESFRAVRRFYQETQLNEAQLEQLNQSIDQSGVRFDRQEREAATANVLAAAETGFDQNLTEKEKKALANYLNVDAVGSDRYNAELERISQENLTAQTAARNQVHLQNEATEVGIDAQRQALNAADYALSRQQALDPVEDAEAFNARAWNAARNGDVGMLNTYLSWVENPEAFPAQAQALEAAGITAERLRDWKGTAQTNLTMDQQTKENQAIILREQVEQAVLATEQDQFAHGQNIAQNFESVEQFETFLQENPDMARLLGERPIAMAATRSNISTREMLGEEEDAWRNFQAVSSIRPEGAEATQAALATMERSLVQAGMAEDVAASIADGYQAAWARGASEYEMANRQAEAKLALAQAQRAQAYAGIENDRQALALREREFESVDAQRKAERDAAEAEQRLLEAGQHPDQLKAQADMVNQERQVLNSRLDVIQTEMEQNGCVMPQGASIEAWSVEMLRDMQAANQDNPACSTAANDLTDTKTQLDSYISWNTANETPGAADTGGGTGTGTPAPGQPVVVGNTTLDPNVLQMVTEQMAGNTPQQVRSMMKEGGYTDEEIDLYFEGFNRTR